MRSRMRGLFLGAAVTCLLAGCASAPTHTWDMAKIARARPGPFRLTDAKSHATLATLTGNGINTMLAAHRRIESASGTYSHLYLADMHQANAFATQTKTGPAIFVTVQMAQKLGQLEPEWAALFGHETAHIAHGDMQTKKSRNAAIEAGDAIVRVISIVTTGVDPELVTGTAALMVEDAYSREQEAAADATSVQYLCEAGYDPHAAIALQKDLVRWNGANSLSYLSDHPSGPQRIAALEKLVAKGCPP